MVYNVNDSQEDEDNGTTEDRIPFHNDCDTDIHKQTINEEDRDIETMVTRPQKQCCSQRWIMAYMGAWLGIMTYLLSTNMSVTVVCMVKENDFKTELSIEEYKANSTMLHGINTEEMTNMSSFNGIQQYQAVIRNISYEQSNATAQNSHTTGEFTWSRTTQSFILSGYFYGYLLVQIPGGWLGTKFGGRRAVGCSMTVASLLTMLIPVFARTSLYLIVSARILLGITVGVALPNFCGLVGAWALPTERSRMNGLIYFGQLFGAVLAYSTSGVLCVAGFDNGWASVFYIHGMFGVLFIGCWWYLVYNSPNEHPRITLEEKTLILKYTGNRHCHKKAHIPWRKILTYFPLYVSYTAHICDTWTFYLLLTCLPQYLKEILHFDIQSNGLLSCVPFVSFMIGIAVAGAGADFIRSKNVFTITRIRKIFLITGFMGITCFIVVPGFLTSEQRALSIMCLSFSSFFIALELTAGYSTNAVDIAPRYASVIFGISSTIASIPGAIVPFLVAVITKNQTVEEWRIVFYISAGISVFACVVYGLFANNEPAPWADINVALEIEVEPSNTLPKKVLPIAVEKVKENKSLLG